MKLLIKSGQIVDPSQSLDMKGDVLVVDGRIYQIATDISDADATVLDASGCVVAPGFIDVHVHLREPGREDVETIETGTKAAAAGGFTSVCSMANTNPVNDNRTVTRFILERAAQAGAVNVFPIGAITQGLKGETLAEIGEMYEAGIVAISDDGQPVMNAQIMRRALEYAKQLGIPVVDHCEDKNLSAGGAMNEGYWSTVLGLKGISRTAEEAHVARDILLADLTGAHVHIAHVSTAGSVQLVRQAKRQGIHVTCEATPHHFTLTDEAVCGYDTNTKMNPPLRSEKDVEAVLEGLADGTVDVIATDHAPHHADDKTQEFDKAPYGIIGLETAVSLALDRLVSRKLISLSRLIELLSTAPARVMNINRGTLKLGSIADVTILEQNQTITVASKGFKSKSRNTPFDGWQLRGAVKCTLVAGRIVYDASAS
jgi:dihydroorotase